MMIRTRSRRAAATAGADADAGAGPAQGGSQPRGRSRRRTLAMIAITAGLLLLIPLLAAELVARVALAGLSDRRAALDRIYGHVLNSGVRPLGPEAPGYDATFGFHPSPDATMEERTDEFAYRVTTNSLGFRGPEPVPRRPGEFRVMLVGDSMFWGVGCDEPDTIRARLEEVARRATGRGDRLSVANCSVIGYDTVQELLVTETFAPRVQPDHIILAFTVCNDIVPNARATIDERGRYARSEARDREIRADILSWLRPWWHSAAFRVVAPPAWGPRIRYQIAMEPRVLRRSVDLVGRIDAYCRRRGITLTVLVCYPMDAIQGGLVVAWSGSERVGRTLVGRFRARGIRTLDLMDDIHGPGDRWTYFYPKDKHPNALGNRKIAEILWIRDLSGRLSGPSSATMAADGPRAVR